MIDLPRMIEEVVAEPGVTLRHRIIAIGIELSERFEGITDRIYDDLRAQILDLIRAEQEGDLCWMDLRSWYAFPYRVRDRFTQLIAPFLWGKDGGLVLFRFREFALYASDLVPRDTLNVALVVDAGNWRLVATRST